MNGCTVDFDLWPVSINNVTRVDDTSINEMRFCQSAIFRGGSLALHLN